MSSASAQRYSDEQTIEWLEGLAERGGKGTVNNIDARALGRIAARLRSLANDCARLDHAKTMAHDIERKHIERIAELEKDNAALRAACERGNALYDEHHALRQHIAELEEQVASYDSERTKTRAVLVEQHERIAELETAHNCKSTTASGDEELIERLIEHAKSLEDKFGYAQTALSMRQAVYRLRSLAERIAELKANLAAAHVRIAQLEKGREVWRATSYHHYKEIERQKERIAELEANLASAYALEAMRK